MKVTIPLRFIHFLFIGTILIGCQQNPPPDSEPLHFCQDPLWAQILEKIHKESFESPDNQKIKEGILNGMLTALDPYSGYMNQETYELFKESTEGEFGGIGIDVLSMEDCLRIIAPMDGTPAAKAGLQPGDFIIKVDGEAVNQLTQVTLFKKIHGKPGTPVCLTIQRGSQDPFDVILKRAIITVNPVKYKREGTIGYLRISYFNEKTTGKLKEAIQILKKEGLLTGVVIDLRNNPGGTLEQAIRATSLFLSKGKIVEVRFRDPGKNVFYEGEGEDLLKKIPLILLVNGGSASASEIMAGALKDYKRAIILGQTTLGKGSVQALFPLQDKKGAIKLTTSRFYTPLGHEIHRKGIKPDIVVPDSFSPSKEKGDYDDPQLNRAIDLLKGMALLEESFKEP